jgi:hypothetical protein
MIIDENGQPVELDYKGTYNQFAKEKGGYKEQLHSVILSCASLEFSINDLVEIQIKKLPSPILKEWSNNPNVPINAKIKALRFANIISEELYKNLSTLFKIRNKFAHNMPLPPKILESEFGLLKDVNIGNDFVKNLPNNSAKFQVIVSHCFTELLYISKKLDPSSVLDGTLVGEITPIEE